MENNVNWFNIVVTVMTLIPEQKPQFRSCTLSTTKLPSLADRDYLINVVNTQTELICDDIVAMFYNGETLLTLPDDMHYKDYWEDRNKIKG